MEISIVCRCFLFLLLCICLSCQGCMEEEREALLQIKASINTPQGTAFSSWYEEDCCQWEGVECNASTTRVTNISFYRQRDQNLLENWYPNATLFAQFKDLQVLELPGNQIGGFTSPHELQKLKHLQKLDLHDNLIENASHLCWGKGALPSLWSLDLSQNKLRGLIPECVCDSLPLKELILYDNKLQGNISSCLSKMTSLELLDLSNNPFNHSFPSLLVQNLTRIESLKLSRNLFKGKVHFPFIFTNLSRISYLDISYNDLQLETESPTWFPSFNISVLNLAGCNLQKIPSFLSTQNNLKFLDLSDNFIVGNFPSWLMHATTSHLWVGGNYLSGPFPETFGNISSQLTSLNISNNNFHGPLPEDINLIYPELLYLDASFNDFNGCIPPSLGRLKRLSFLDLSRNKLHGEIPISNMSSLEHLNLRDNNLRGDALPRNSSLPKLKILDLSKNDFSGTFLDSLLWSLSQLFSLSQIRLLILRKNSLEGQLSRQICQMRRLHILDLSENSISGDIPDCIDNITSWTVLEQAAVYFDEISINNAVNNFPNVLPSLDLSSNRFTGSIPVQVTRLTGLSGLNMSHNLLTGQIPESLGNLTALEWLDLSDNKLFGELSMELLDLTFLSYFNVSFNNLSGQIPLGMQFGTFGNDSYVGNPGLCGAPLSKGCASVEKKPSYSYAMSSQIWPPQPTICYFLALILFFL